MAYSLNIKTSYKANLGQRSSSASVGLKDGLSNKNSFLQSESAEGGVLCGRSGSIPGREKNIHLTSCSNGFIMTYSLVSK